MASDQSFNETLPLAEESFIAYADAAHEGLKEFLDSQAPPPFPSAQPVNDGAVTSSAGSSPSSWSSGWKSSRPRMWEDEEAVRFPLSESRAHEIFYASRLTGKRKRLETASRRLFSLNFFIFSYNFSIITF